MSWKLFLDDDDIVYRQPPDSSYLVACSSEEAISYVKDHGLPSHMDLDHDLGGEDDSLVFLRWLIQTFLDVDKSLIPTYQIHSANPVAYAAITSLMESWKKY